MSLNICNLNKSYNQRFFKKVKVVKDLNIRIEKGEIYALVGQNGVGKTTTVKCILNYIMDKKGVIEFENEDISKIIENCEVGYMPETVTYSDTISMRSYLSSICILKGIEKRKINERIECFARLFDMDKSLDLIISKHSKGMKKKIGFIQAIINDPKLLILDEPTDGLDPVSRRKMLEIIKKLSKDGVCVLITSHVLADLQIICDKIGLMNDGKIVNEIEVSEYLDSKVKYDFIIENNETKEVYAYSLLENGCININCTKGITIKEVKASFSNLEDWYFDTLKQEREYVKNN